MSDVLKNRFQLLIGRKESGHCNSIGQLSAAVSPEAGETFMDASVFNCGLWSAWPFDRLLH